VLDLSVKQMSYTSRALAAAREQIGQQKQLEQTMFSCGSGLLGNTTKLDQSGETRNDHVRQLNDAYAMFFKQPKSGFNELFSPLGRDLNR
jgi:hypothetical protein